MSEEMDCGEGGEGIRYGVNKTMGSLINPCSVVKAAGVFVALTTN